MKSAIIAAALLIIVNNAAAQEFTRPNYDEIRKKSTDKSSVYYYPGLIKRFKNNDTTLQADEYKYLYYGSFFNEPRQAINEDVETVAEINKIFDKSRELTEKDKQKLIALCKKAIGVYPYDMRRLNNLYNLYKGVDDDHQARLYQKRLLGLAFAIVGSGDGKTQQTAYHVTDVSHEYVMLSIFGYRFKSQTLLHDPECDYMSVQKNEDGVEGVYFDITQIWNNYDEVFQTSDITYPQNSNKN